MRRTLICGLIGAGGFILLLLAVMAIWGFAADTGLEDHGSDGSISSRLGAAVFFLVAGGFIYAVPTAVLGFVVGGGISFATRSK